jgi:hypothetical protein
MRVVRAIVERSPKIRKLRKRFIRVLLIMMMMASLVVMMAPSRSLIASLIRSRGASPQDIVRIHVPMAEPSPVKVLEGLRNPARNLPDLGAREARRRWIRVARDRLHRRRLAERAEAGRIFHHADEPPRRATAAAAAADTDAADDAAAAADEDDDDEDDDDEEAWDEDAEGEADTPMSLIAAPPPLLIPTPSDSPPKEHSKVRSPPRLLLEPRKPVRRSLPEMRSRLRHVGRTTPRGGITPRGFSGATAAIPAAPLALDESATPRTLYLSKLSTANTPSGVSDFLEEARAKLRRSKSRKPRLTYADVDKTPLPHEGYFRRDPRVPPLPMSLMNFPQNNPMLLVDAAPLPPPGGMGYAPNMGYAPPEEDYDA